MDKQTDRHIVITAAAGACSALASKNYSTSKYLCVCVCVCTPLSCYQPPLYIRYPRVPTAVVSVQLLVHEYTHLVAKMSVSLQR